MTRLLHAEVTGAIIATYYDVFNDLSRSYPEYTYKAAMMWSLQNEERIPCAQQGEYEVCYKDRPVGKQRLDIFVAGEVVVESKTAERIEKINLAPTHHPAIIRSASFCLSAFFCQSALEGIP
jgi:GxxExxY protein